MPTKKRLNLDKIRLPGTRPVAPEASPAQALPRPVSQPAGQPSRQLTPPLVMHLQRQIGNRAVGRLLNRARSQVIQPKLVVGPARDKYEQEADQIARQVVQKTGTPETAQNGTVATVQRLGGEGGFEAGHEIESQIAAQRGGGRPLPASVRAQVEPRLGADFSGVRVHTDAAADVLNQSLSARAFTTGQDIFFRRGGYNPGSATGQELLAHELTHVVQQTQNGQTPPGSNAQPPAHIQTAPLPSDSAADQKAKEDEEKRRKAAEEALRKAQAEAEAKRKQEEEARRRAKEKRG